ncbi:hypothetical protein WA026_006726 [Henosepilachna vigintioctopunctata]|uniref:Uncharacterized protein n=1 Tax=Henosepilachna vigintioctopunctata TaxID=420089 RepID=A0AAW1U9Q3_9CUCU
MRHHSTKNVIEDILAVQLGFATPAERGDVPRDQTGRLRSVPGYPVAPQSYLLSTAEFLLTQMFCIHEKLPIAPKKAKSWGPGGSDRKKKFLKNN